MRLCTKWTWLVRSLGWEINHTTESVATRRNVGSKSKMAMTLILPPKTDIMQVLIQPNSSAGGGGVMRH